MVPSGKTSERQGTSFGGLEILAAVITILLFVFALGNLEQVTADFSFARWTLPVFFVIAVPAFLGFGVDVLFGQRATASAP